MSKISKQLPIKNLKSDVPHKWHIADEVAVAIIIDQQNYAIMMLSPADLEDFAYGFALSENIIRSATDITRIEILQHQQGYDLTIHLADIALERFRIMQKRRNMVANSSCGLCGVSSFDDVNASLKNLTIAREVDFDVMAKAVEDFRNHMPQNAQIKSLHGAAFVSLKGEYLFAREDIGRHNALDKLIGAMLRADVNPSAGFVVLSSRFAYELAQKAIRANIHTLISISAPTLKALELSQKYGLNYLSFDKKLGLVEIKA